MMVMIQPKQGYIVRNCDNKTDPNCRQKDDWKILDPHVMLLQSGQRASCYVDSFRPYNITNPGNWTRKSLPVRGELVSDNFCRPKVG